MNAGISEQKPARAKICKNAWFLNKGKINSDILKNLSLVIVDE